MGKWLLSWVVSVVSFDAGQQAGADATPPIFQCVRPVQHQPCINYHFVCTSLILSQFPCVLRASAGNAVAAAACCGCGRCQEMYTRPAAASAHRSLPKQPNQQSSQPPSSNPLQLLYSLTHANGVTHAKPTCPCQSLLLPPGRSHDGPRMHGCALYPTCNNHLVLAMPACAFWTAL